MNTLNRSLYGATVILLLFASLTTQSQNFTWAKTSGGTNASVKPPYWYPTLGLDNSGNSYQAVTLSGTADFNPGSATFNLNSTNGPSVILKLDANGNFVWAKQLTVAVSSLATDGDGYSYITGSFSGTADLDPGPATVNLVSAGYSDVFVAKLDAGGNLIWAKQVGGPGQDGAAGLTLDPNKNICISGSYGQGPTGGTSADFDPDPLTSYNLTSAGNKDAFVLVLDVNGNFSKVKTWGGATFDAAGTAISDASGNIYVFGTFTGTVTFDGSNTLSTTNQAWIIMKIDAGGNYSWIRNLGSAVQGFGMNIDAQGDYYISGSFSGTNDFDPGPAVVNYSAVSGQDGFYSKFSTDGNLMYARHIRANGVPNAITTDASGNLFLTGSFTGTNVDFNPGAGTANLKSSVRAMYILSLDAAGNFNWVKQIGGEGKSTTIGRWIALSAGGDVYSSIEFTGSIDADPGPAKVTIKALGTDLCIHKLSSSSGFAPLITEQIETIRPAIFPNPSKGQFSISLPGLEKQVLVSVNDMNGRLIYQDRKTPANNKIDISLIGALPGVYHVTLISGSEKRTENIKIQ